MFLTVLHSEHVRLGARIVDFAGWEMPVQYPGGILAEHLNTRCHAGLFDVSHMGRFRITGSEAVRFLERTLTNAASRLPRGMSHYTIIPDETGGAVDDAYLYHFAAGEYLLVVNASNRDKDLKHLTAELQHFPAAHLEDISDQTGMISLQGPASERLLDPLLDQLPVPGRNACAKAHFNGSQLFVSRTGYTGEPTGFEFITPIDLAVELWTQLLDAGATPVGLGARDTLRLEAALPLYGHEFGQAPDGDPIPIFACPLARFGVALAPHRDGMIGYEALRQQTEALAALKAGDTAATASLPRRTRALALSGRGIARAGAVITAANRAVGWITSGTMVPYWEFADGRPTETSGRRALALGLLDSTLRLGDEVVVQTPNREIKARLVPRFLDNGGGPYAVPVWG